MAVPTYLRQQRAALTPKGFLHLFLTHLGGVRPPFPQYAQDPVGFGYEVLGVKVITDKQVEILESIRDNRETNVQAGYNVGKTWVAGYIAVLWWVFSVGGYCVTTAKTSRQVERILWKEIRDAYDTNQVKLGGFRTESRLVLSEKIQAWGFTASEYSEASAAGIHEDLLLAIIDEAGEVSDKIDKNFKGWIGGSKNRGLRIGNPNKEGTAFAKACSTRGSIRICSFDHPNITWAYGSDRELKPEVREAIMPDDPGLAPGELLTREQWPDWCQKEDVVPGAVSVEWIEETRADPMVGPGTPYWESKVMGFFPSDAATALVPRAWFEKARQRYEDDRAGWEGRTAQIPWRHGLDIGDGVDDHSLASVRGDLLASIHVKATKGDGRDSSRAVALAISILDGSRGLGPGRPGRINVDRGGPGAGPYDALLGQEYDAYGIFFGAKPSSKKRRQFFPDLRCQMLWALRLRFEGGTIAIGRLPKQVEHRLKEELATIEWEVGLTGRIEIESKKKIKAKLGFSPDVSDSVAMAYHDTGTKQTKPSHW